MTRKEKMEKYGQIAKRANSILEEYGMTNYSASNLMLDVESLDIQFHMKLEDWLNAEDFDFMHDIVEMIRCTNRTTFPCVYNYFVPRFASSDVISSEVIEHVKQYLENNNLGQLVSIKHSSYHPDDAHLYHIIAKKNAKYHCWTCWNELTKTLNHGHYDLLSFEQAENICSSCYYEG